MQADFENDLLTYSILDPTGNITALVTSAVSPEKRTEAAQEIMRLHPEVEQVGFVRFADPAPDKEAGNGEPEIELAMAGGEFCGNASMSAAAMYLLRQEQEQCGGSESGKTLQTVRLRVSGAEQVVEVTLEKQEDGSFHADVLMPPALKIERREFAFGIFCAELPVVFMGGISHIIIEEASTFAFLIWDKQAAEAAAESWCGELDADGLGLMFLRYDDLTPLVYVPASGTMVWENSCASGTTAAGMYLAEKSGRPVSLTFGEPGGTLTVQSDSSTGRTVLSGTVRMR